jgi:hypothetical protein
MSLLLLLLRLHIAVKSIIVIKQLCLEIMETERDSDIHIQVVNRKRVVEIEHIFPEYYSILKHVTK